MVARDMCVVRIISKTLWGSCLLAMAQSAMADDIMEVYQKALQNDPQILGARYAHSAAGELVEESFGRMLPQVGFDYSYNDTTQDVLSSSNENPLISSSLPVGKSEFKTTEYSLTLTQPIFSWGLYTGYEQAQTEVLRADAELVSKQQDLILRTAERYIEVLAAADESGFAAAEKAAVNKQLELVQTMMRNGMARKTELYDAQARYASVEADEIGANSAHDDRLQALREMVGELSGPLAKFKDSLDLVYPEPANPEEWMQVAIKQNPRIVSQLRVVDVSRYEVSLQKAGHMPTLGLVARFTNRDSGNTNAQLGGKDASEIETGEIMLNLNVPLYQGGIVSSRARQSEQLHQKARQELTEMQRAVQRAARAAYHGIISAISKVEALAKSVKSQKLALHSKQQGYRSGLYTSLHVLDAESDVYEAKRDYSRARYDYLLNGLRLKHAVGTINKADVEGLNSLLQAGENIVQQPEQEI